MVVIPVYTVYTFEYYQYTSHLNNSNVIVDVPAPSIAEEHRVSNTVHSCSSGAAKGSEIALLY